MARGERVPRIARRAVTVGHMMHRPALRSQAARPRTGVHTLVVHTRLAAGTVRVHHALRATPGVRVAEILGQAGARRRAVTLATDRVGSAREVLTGVGGLRRQITNFCRGRGK